MKLEIKHYISGSVLFSLETKSLKLTLEAAVEAKTDLTGAYLTGAYLTGADLTGADLTGADLTGAGDEKIEILRYLNIGPIGSRLSYLNVFFTKKGVFTHTGCFRGTLEEFEAKAQREHGDNEHGVAYAAAVAFIRAIATSTPKKKKAAA